MSAFFRVSALICLATAVSLAPVSGQISTGTIVGVVEDSSGAVVPNADVTLTHTSTAETRQTRTTSSGEFTVPFLHLGNYTVTVTAAALKPKRSVESH